MQLEAHYLASHQFSSVSHTVTVSGLQMLPDTDDLQLNTVPDRDMWRYSRTTPAVLLTCCSRYALCADMIL